MFFLILAYAGMCMSGIALHWPCSANTTSICCLQCMSVAVCVFIRVWTWNFFVCTQILASYKTRTRPMKVLEAPGQWRHAHMCSCAVCRPIKPNLLEQKWCYLPCRQQHTKVELPTWTTDLLTIIKYLSVCLRQTAGFSRQCHEEERSPAIQSCFSVSHSQLWQYIWQDLGRFCALHFDGGKHYFGKLSSISAPVQ